MDISSVRIRPVQALAQAVMTSTHGHPRPNWPKVAQFNRTILPVLQAGLFYIEQQVVKHATCCSIFLATYRTICWLLIVSSVGYLS